MTIYQEFAGHAERRRRRLARQQFWFKWQREWNRNRDFWLCVLTMAAAGAIGVFLAVLMNPR